MFFSVIIPMYNSQNSIKRCLESVLSQTYKNFEVIIVNDGSTDKSAKICESFLYDKRVKLINQNNAGVSEARNRGIVEATAGYVIFLDADDYLEKDMLNTYYEIINIHNPDIIVSPFYERIKQCFVKKNYPEKAIEKKFKIEDLGDIFDECYKAGMWNNVFSKCFKKSNITNFFDVSLSLAEDTLFVFNYLKNCKTIYISSYAMYNYTINYDNSLSSRFNINNFYYINKSFLEIESLVKSIWVSANFFEVHNKYISDICVLAERMMLAKGISLKNKKDILINSVNEFEKVKVIKVKDYNQNIKMKVSYFLLKNNLYHIFYYYVHIIKVIKKFWRKIQ